ncbi:PIN domain-containing protein [Thorsellia anophelis]|uniref:PIN-like domain-containing protein n=1 Tax=Thorsellia anophelis DSM 18579 TaxID=1123402 RepID=A0A1I0C2N2_9GAMM|nr:PIN domain-containing protein [Thorsellia anophelis]SET13265.1 hypothetical protein SAMN02583745_01460 [Thorsellia anophelis DSM 18579]
MTQKWIFIDLTAVTNINAVNFDEYTRIILFIPQNSPNLDLSINRQKKPVNMTLINVPVNQVNSISLFISLYIGIYDSQTDKKIDFVILSHYSGFTDLTKHMSILGRNCTTINVQSLKALAPSSSDEIDAAVEALKTLWGSGKIKNYPKKLTALRNVINSTNKALSGAQITSIIDKLCSEKIITLNGQNITFNLSKFTHAGDYTNKYEIIDNLDIPF